MRIFAGSYTTELRPQAGKSQRLAPLAAALARRVAKRQPNPL